MKTDHVEMPTETGKGDSLSVYIHIPFCTSKCYYCDFCSQVPNEDEVAQYFSALETELLSYQSLLSRKKISTIYFGGGTPSCVDTQYIVRIIDVIRNICDVCLDAELTFEANPNSLTAEKTEHLLSAGINRFSLGVQTLSEKTLNTIGRKQTVKQALAAMELLHKRKVNFSADLMLGLPFQTKKSFLNDLKKVLSFQPNHLSVYMLKVEEKTPLCNLVKSGKIILPNEDECVDLYDCVFQQLKKNGYLRYEVSNFAKEGFQSRHNMNYWQHGSYLGLGLAAHSFLENTRFSNTENLDEYLKGNCNQQAEILTKKQLKQEKIMLALRTKVGLIDYQNWIDEKKIYGMRDYLTITPTHLSVKDEFFGVMNEIIIKLF